jgi:hypothetical protein
MKTLHLIYHVALADFYERARRFSFLLTLAAVIGLGILVFNGSVVFQLRSVSPDPYAPVYQGEPNSAWIGTMTVLATNTFLMLFGFYLVSDCIKRDIHTGVGQIIATTPVSRGTYLVGKWISNFAVLSVMEVILAVAAVIMVLLQSEAALDLAALLMPFLTVAFPAMAFTAALAVIFETVPWLRGAVGNIVFFFLWMGIGVVSISMVDKYLPINDPLGFNVFYASLHESAQAAFPNDMISGFGTGITAVTQIKRFSWPGLAWSAGIVGSQWLWAVVSPGLILLSALWFTRFDPSREGHRHAKRKTAAGEEDEAFTPRKGGLHTILHVLATPASRLAQLVDLSPLIAKIAQASPFLGVLFAELRLLLKGRRWWWWLITIGLNIAIIFSPFSTLKEYVLPVAWLWLLPVVAQMGSRERMNNTYQMVFSSTRPVLRQLPAAWLAGILSTGLLVIAGAVVFLINRDLIALAGWAGAVIFVPTLALALGVFSSGNRLFEIAYVIWWYCGPMQKIPGIDFTSGSPQVYLMAAGGLLLLSAYWRGRQVRA